MPSSVRSDLGVGYFPCLEHCKHGDRADAILGRQLGIFIDIELNELDLTGKLGGDFFEAGCNHLARAAPWCPEVNYDRFGRVQNLFLEIGSIDFQSRHCILRPDGQCPVVIGRVLFDTLIYVKSVRSLYFDIFPHQATATCLGTAAAVDKEVEAVAEDDVRFDRRREPPERPLQHPEIGAALVVENSRLAIHTRRRPTAALLLSCARERCLSSSANMEPYAGSSMAKVLASRRAKPFE